MLVKHLLGETTPSEAGLVLQWINSSPSNQAYYDELKKVWDTSRQLATQSTVDENKAWEKFQRRIQLAEPIAPVKKIQTNWMKIAASVILIIGLGSVGYWLLNKEKPVQPMLVSTGLNTLIDTLPDGSTVTLNKKSSISYPSRFNGKTRDIELKGEAFFHVTPDKTKPFIIKVNEIQVTVVGTSFNIRSGNGATEVIVETGIVRVTRNGETIELKANEKTVVANSDSTIAKQPVSDQLYNYYRSHEFVCDGTPLWKLVEVLNEAYDTKIVVGRKELRDLPLTTTFNNTSLDQILEVISETFSIKITRTPGEIILE